jgi:signal transduction histidine kinase
MQLVFSNAKAATSIIELFEEIDGIEIAPVSQKPVSAAELHSSLEALVKELSDLARIQSQRIIVGERGYVPESLPLAIDLNLTEKVFRELLVNAMKFSVPASEIYVTFQMAEHGIRVSVLNSPIEDQFGHRGIPPAYQNIIFDPFYRMSKHVFEEYGTHDIGLGLTLVDRILRRMGGSISAYNVKNHVNREMSDLFVNFEVELKTVNAV